jgi:hypothetical protein
LSYHHLVFGRAPLLAHSLPIRIAPHKKTYFSTLGGDFSLSEQLQSQDADLAAHCVCLSAQIDFLFCITIWACDKNEKVIDWLCKCSRLLSKLLKSPASHLRDRNLPTTAPHAHSHARAQMENYQFSLLLLWLSAAGNAHRVQSEFALDWEMSEGLLGDLKDAWRLIRLISAN